MELRSQIGFYRKEHDEILRFLKQWEGALNLADSAEEAERCKGLAQLVELQRKVLEVPAHCKDEEQNLDSPFQIYLDDHSLDHLHRQHDEIHQLTDGYENELRYITTPPPAADLVAVGRRLIAALRRHIAFEEGLLKRIEDGNEAEEKLFLRYTQPAE